MSFLKNLLNLHQGEEKKEKVIEDILSNISFRGANLWILACAILIASIGLNVNSTAVIIGGCLSLHLWGTRLSPQSLTVRILMMHKCLDRIID